MTTDSSAMMTRAKLCYHLICTPVAQCCLVPGSVRMSQDYGQHLSLKNQPYFELRAQQSPGDSPTSHGMLDLISFGRLFLPRRKKLESWYLGCRQATASAARIGRTKSGWAPWSRAIHGNPGTRVFNHGGPKAGKDKAWWERIRAER